MTRTQKIKEEPDVVALKKKPEGYLNLSFKERLSICKILFKMLQIHISGDDILLYDKDLENYFDSNDIVDMLPDAVEEYNGCQH